MARFRYLYCSFYKDDNVLEFYSVLEKFLYIFLLTNPNTTQIGIYKIHTKEISFLTGIEEEQIIEILDKFENEYKTIKYNKKTREIGILNWGKYNLNKIGGKPIYDCIKSELKNVEDVSLIEDVLQNIDKEEVRNLFIQAIKEKGDGCCDHRRTTRIKVANKFKEEDTMLYAKPSKEQLRKARELYS